jgi:hypothetical protein
MQHLIHACPSAKDGFQSLRREAHLIQSELDCIDGLGGLDGIVLLLIGLDQRGQNLQTILIVTARLGSVHEHVDLLKSLLQIKRYLLPFMLKTMRSFPTKLALG